MGKFVPLCCEIVPASRSGTTVDGEPVAVKKRYRPDGSIECKTISNCGGRCRHGRCQRCRFKWCEIDRQVDNDEHSTPFGGGSGCFPLCEKCWMGLTPGQRLPFYEDLISTWGEGSQWLAIKAAVLAGL